MTHMARELTGFLYPFIESEERDGSSLLVSRATGTFLLHRD